MYERQRRDQRSRRRSVRPDQLSEPDEWRERKLARAMQPERGRRFCTICCRMRAYRRLVPDLRIFGHWLQRAGFDRGLHYEIKIREGSEHAGDSRLLLKGLLGETHVEARP